MNREKAISQLLGRDVEFADGNALLIVGETMPSEQAIQQVLSEAAEQARISSIRAEASRRVREIFGTGEEKITQMAEAMGRIYADLKAQGLLTVGTIAALDPQMEKLNQAKAIRERAEAMILNPELTWE